MGVDEAMIVVDCGCKVLATQMSYTTAGRGLLQRVFSELWELRVKSGHVVVGM